MSIFIGNVKGPRHNSPDDAVDVWCNPNEVELRMFDGVVERSLDAEGVPVDRGDVFRALDPIAARNLAALLVRASEEVERMAARRARDACDDKTPMPGD